MISGRLRSALSKVPSTNPSCTESVSQLAAPALKFHSLVSDGITAEPLNQSDIPSNSAIAKSASVPKRDLFGTGSGNFSVGLNARDCSARGKEPLGKSSRYVEGNEARMGREQSCLTRVRNCERSGNYATASMRVLPKSGASTSRERFPRLLAYIA